MGRQARFDGGGKPPRDCGPVEAPKHVREAQWAGASNGLFSPFFGDPDERVGIGTYDCIRCSIREVGRQKGHPDKMGNEICAVVICLIHDAVGPRRAAPSAKGRQWVASILKSSG